MLAYEIAGESRFWRGKARWLSGMLWTQATESKAKPATAGARQCRQERTVQASLFDIFAQHEIGRELKTMSDWLDGHRELLRLVAADLRRGGEGDRAPRAAGRGG